MVTETRKTAAVSHIQPVLIGLNKNTQFIVKTVELCDYAIQYSDLRQMKNQKNGENHRAMSFNLCYPRIIDRVATKTKNDTIGEICSTNIKFQLTNT
jgi:hypothetical protein